MGRKKISSEVKETVNEVKETANGVKETDISEESSNVIITESGQEIIPASKENKQLLVDVSPKDTPKMVTGGLISYEDQINRGIELMKKGIQGRLLIGQALVNIKAKEDLTELGYSNIYDFCDHKFRMGRTIADNCMFLYTKLSHINPKTNEPELEEEYKKFNLSLLLLYILPLAGLCLGVIGGYLGAQALDIKPFDIIAVLCGIIISMMVYLLVWAFRRKIDNKPTAYIISQDKE